MVRPHSALARGRRIPDSKMMMDYRQSCWTALVLLTVFATIPARASTVRYMTDSQMAHEADVVAFGKIVRIEYLADAHGITMTRGAFQVYYGVKNAAPGEIFTVQTLGGERSGLWVNVAGAPRFEPGQLWFGFFERATDNTLRPFGMLMGMLPVLRAGRRALPDSDTSLARFVVRRNSGINAIGKNGLEVSVAHLTLPDTDLQDYIDSIAKMLTTPAVGLPDRPGRPGVKP